MFHGSLVALVTPMQTDGTVDVESLQRLIEWQINEGTHGIVLLGTTGEPAVLTHGERKLIIEQGRLQIKGRVPLIVGTGTNCTAASIHLTAEAMQSGADACLLIAPYCNKPTQEGLYLHYKSIADQVPVPQILYNQPSRTGCDLHTETVARLSALPNIIGIKEGTGDLNRVQELLAACNDRLDLFSGDDATGREFILKGGKGVISVTANVAPRLMQQMCSAALKGDAKAALAFDQKLTGLHQSLFVESNPIPVKWALKSMGKVSEGIRLPLTPLSAQYHETVEIALQQADIK